MGVGDCPVAELGEIVEDAADGAIVDERLRAIDADPRQLIPWEAVARLIGLDPARLRRPGRLDLDLRPGRPLTPEQIAYAEDAQMFDALLIFDPATAGGQPARHRLTGQDLAQGAERSTIAPRPDEGRDV